jgi:hypothetical protein
MGLDAQVVRLTRLGIVTIYPDATPSGIQIVVEGFEARGGSCRDVAVLATIWAIGELQRSLLATFETPGGGAIGVD